MLESLGLIMRWLHISSMATILGGLLYARLVLFPAGAALPAGEREALHGRAAAAFRPLAWLAMAGLTVSGIYAIVSAPGHSVRYHAVLGIKLLLVAHVFAVTMLVVEPKRERRARLMTGGVITGLIITFIAAYLHRIF